MPSGPDANGAGPVTAPTIATPAVIAPDARFRGALRDEFETTGFAAVGSAGLYLM